MEASRQSADLFRLVVENVRDFAVFATDMGGRIVSWNPGVGRVLGFREEEWVGHDASIIFTEEDRERKAPEREMETALREGRAEDKRWHLRQDGSRFWGNGLLMLLRDEGGAPRGFAKILRDDSEAKRAEELLLRERDFSAAVIDSLPGIFYLFNAEGVYVRWNRNFELVTGYSAEEISRMRPPDFFAAEDRPLLEGRIGEVFTKGRATLEAPLLTKGGGRIPYYLTGNRFTFEGAECVLGVGTDISDRRRAEAERDRLAAERERERLMLEQVLQQMPSGVSIAEAPSGKLLYHNDEAVRLIRHPLRESGSYDGYRQYGALHADGTPYEADEYPIARALLAGEVVRNEEMIYRRGDGTLTEFSVNAAPVRDVAGETVAAVSSFDDISELKRAQRELSRLLESEREARRQAEEANRLKDEFLATLSHELRTPLTAVLGWARLLRAGALDEVMQRRALEAVERNADAQRQLIEDILEVSRIITGKLRLDLQPVSVVSVVESAVDAVRPTAEAKRVALVVEVSPQIGLISGDPDRLRQVVWNLLSNAVKFTPEGGRVEVSAGLGGGGVMIRVTDTGRGIGPEFLPHVFERFRQADASTTRQHGGLGLGLAIVRHIVELHGGEVGVESEGEGRGATFTVTLPLTARPQERHDVADGAVGSGAARGERADDCPPSLDGLRVLLVDDEADARDVLSAVLEKCGAEVDAVASAADALEAFGRGGFDLVISDIGMPGEDGYTLIGRIRELERRAGAAQTPAVALTAYAREEDRVRAFRAGFQMHLVKPVEPGELTAVVASLAGRAGGAPVPRED